jgi:hypothetical protein
MGEGQVVVLNSWSFAYFSVDQRRAYVELLATVASSRPVVWLCMDAPGVVELPVDEPVPAPDSPETDVLSMVTFEGRTPPRAQVLAFVQSHGQSLDWRATPAPAG